VRAVLWSLVALRGYAEVGGVSAVYDRAELLSGGLYVREFCGSGEKGKGKQAKRWSSEQQWREKKWIIRAVQPARPALSLTLDRLTGWLLWLHAMGLSQAERLFVRACE
jgi:hypothetical protein